MPLYANCTLVYTIKQNQIDYPVVKVVNRGNVTLMLLRMFLRSCDI